ncbi:flagellin B [Gluconobacter morbifer G707]|uniref:Flagellin n=2 Tax=Gluconobacter TaxID=441 RepID=G6XJT1_9PROT|nr:flagellin B [Gluconobacter morbifer G707]
MSINTNTAAMSALTVLNQTTAQLDQTQNAVSTGKSVASASDNPAIYAISQTMNSQISALKGVSTGLQFAGAALSTASTQGSAIADTLSNMSETVTNAANNGENQDTLNSQLTSYLKQINVATDNSSFQGINLLSGQTGGSVKYTSVSAAQDSNGNLFTQSGFNATASGLGLDGLSTTMKGATLSLAGADSAAATLSATGATADTLTLQSTTAVNGDGTANDPATTTAFVLDDAPGATSGAGSALASEINSAIGLATGTAGTAVSASSSGSLTITGGNPVSNSDGSTVYTFNNSSDPSKSYSITQSSDASGNATYTISSGFDSNGNATRNTQIVDVDTSKASSDTDRTTTLMTAVSNAGFGISRANDGTLTIAGGNLDASSGVQFGTMSAAGTSMSLTADTQAAATTATTSGTDVVQLAVTGAINKMSRITSSLGVASNTITQLQSSNSALSDSLTTGVGALTDADLAAESAKLTSLQTKQQLAIQSLSIANSQSSNIMTLFRG